MAFCASCGKELSAGNRFCTNCGAKVPVMRPYNGSAAAALQAAGPSVQWERKTASGGHYSLVLNNLNDCDTQLVKPVLLPIAHCTEKELEGMLKMLPMEIAGGLNEEKMRCAAEELVRLGISISVYDIEGAVDLRKLFPQLDRLTAEAPAWKEFRLNRKPAEEDGATFLGKKLPQKGLRSFLPPGFRTGTIWHMAVAVIAYLLAADICIDMYRDLFLDGISSALIMALGAMLCGNYRCIWKKFPSSFKKAPGWAKFLKLIPLNLAMMLAVLLLQIGLESVLGIA